LAKGMFNRRLFLLQNRLDFFVTFLSRKKVNEALFFNRQVV